MYSIFLVSLSMHVQSMEHHETNTLSLIFQLLFLDQFRLTSIVHVHQVVELPTLIFAGFLLAMYLSLHSFVVVHYFALYALPLHTSLFLVQYSTVYISSILTVWIFTFAFIMASFTRISITMSYFLLRRLDVDQQNFTSLSNRLVLTPCQN